jgi:hypothetical protein
VYAVDRIADVLARRHYQRERDQEYDREAVVEPKNRGVDLYVRDLDEALEATEYVQHLRGRPRCILISWRLAAPSSAPRPTNGHRLCRHRVRRKRRPHGTSATSRSTTSRSTTSRTTTSALRPCSESVGSRRRRRHSDPRTHASRHPNTGARCATEITTGARATSAPRSHSRVAGNPILAIRLEPPRAKSPRARSRPRRSCEAGSRARTPLRILGLLLLLLVLLLPRLRLHSIEPTDVSSRLPAILEPPSRRPCSRGSSPGSLLIRRVTPLTPLILSLLLLPLLLLPLLLLPLLLTMLLDAPRSGGR